MGTKFYKEVAFFNNVTLEKHIEKIEISEEEFLLLENLKENGNNV
jgi:hypothetical protein